MAVSDQPVTAEKHHATPFVAQYRHAGLHEDHTVDLLITTIDLPERLTDACQKALRFVCFDPVPATGGRLCWFEGSRTVL